ncbi:efflux RND transporter periplasmic adaptor subunit [Rhizobium sp. L1K21]|uniref:efflux RND transporter periplasmic adaptor subunit n=1 Tax=Rhizobium sp. L1K21 TaxID=2954933 RepID=UPI002092A54E|nr:efflux RND transporter periplasmic adaptor subunit [Rhizobium sp. L1K21]MCO6185330.1 efflux RND transporter periplasmic adaptor subunit [Rhizobium sp. L1K21]
MTAAASPSLAADTEGAEPKVSLPAIIVTPVEVRDLVDRVVASGTIQPAEEVFVLPLVDGQPIKTLNVDVGDTVKEGDVLAVLSTDTLILQKGQLEANKAKVAATRAQLEAQLAQVKANTAEAVRQSERLAKLVKSGTVSTAQADQAKAAADAALAQQTASEEALKSNDADMKVIDTQIAEIDLKLARAEVKATASGVISARNAKIGAIAVGAGAQPLFTIIRDGKLQLKADLAESDVLKVKKGQNVKITTTANVKPVDGKVARVEPTVDPTTRLGSVLIDILNPDEARSGMYAQASITIDEHSAPSLPLTAVTSEDGENMARKVEDGVVKLTTVETGIQDGDYIEITSGLQAGDEVIAKAGAYVRDGDRINPVRDLDQATN